MKLNEVLNAVSVHDISSGARKSREATELVKSAHAGEVAVTVNDGKVAYQAQKKGLAASDLEKGQIVLASHNSYNQGAQIYEILGVTDNDAKYGDGGVKFDSVKALMKAKGVNSMTALVHYQKDNAKEYGYHFYLVVKDLDDGDHGAWFYLDDRGRWCYGSGAERLSFTLMKKVSATTVEGLKLVGANLLREAKISSPAAFVNAFQKKFPGAWMKVIDGAPTTGEGAEIGEHAVFMPHAYEHDPHEKVYVMGVLKTVHDWANQQGWHPEAHDAGTLKFYKD